MNAQPLVTAIVSDLHLCEAEPVHPKYPLWKKYKTREFFFDDEFAHFVDQLMQENPHKEIELVLNGDIFDFDSVQTLPEEPVFRISMLERLRGLRPSAQKAVFKMKKIIEDHEVWFESLRSLLRSGHRLVFIAGNHDVELMYPSVQRTLRDALDPQDQYPGKVTFCDWFYISGGDTLVEHGHQYDPYCVCEDPIHPFVARSNDIEIKLPFGNWACRYMINGMGFFNPHVDSNYIMSFGEYVRFFFRYMLRAQPLIIWTWFWGAVMVLVESVRDQFAEQLKDPLYESRRIKTLAAQAGVEDAQVRQMFSLLSSPAGRNPLQIARELWLDRAFFVLFFMYLLSLGILALRPGLSWNLFWFLVPILALLPFFLFYSKSVESKVSEYKEPNERVMALESMILRVNRVVHGHTHRSRHEMIGPVEHLNSGSWSPAFIDVECTESIQRQTYVLIEPRQNDGLRKASLREHRFLH